MNLIFILAFQYLRFLKTFLSREYNQFLSTILYIMDLCNNKVKIRLLDINIEIFEFKFLYGFIGYANFLDKNFHLLC
jgi:hypothetical protein